MLDYCLIVVVISGKSHVDLAAEEKKCLLDPPMGRA